MFLSLRTDLILLVLFSRATYPVETDLFLSRKFQISQVLSPIFKSDFTCLLSNLDCLFLWMENIKTNSLYAKKPLFSQDGNDTYTAFTFVQVFYLLSFHLYKLRHHLAFLLFAQIIDNNFTVRTSAVMSIYRRGEK